MEELKKIGKKTEGNKIKKLESLSKLFNFLGETKPITFE